MKNILFDLDGTLTDPFIGICSAVAYGLKSQNIEPPELEMLKPFIGPPLDESYQKYYGMDEETSWKAVEKFREYFNRQGKFENKVYKGIEECLQKLQDNDFHLYVCTSKPIVFAKEILEYFQLDSYFLGIYGSELDGTRKKKADVIAFCLNQERLETNECIMVGDRMHDIIGAHTHHIPCIGVLYGYGNQKEFEDYHCDYIVETIDDLCRLLIEMKSY